MLSESIGNARKKWGKILEAAALSLWGNRFHGGIVFMGEFLWL